MGWSVEISECDEGHPGVLLVDDETDDEIFLHADEARQIGSWMIQAAQAAEIRKALEAALADSVPPDLKTRILELTNQHWEAMYDHDEAGGGEPDETTGNGRT